MSEKQKERKSPERRCIVTGEIRNKDDLIRFVLGPDQAVVADLDGKLPGRGAWVSAERAVLEQVMRKNPFSRAFACRTTVPDNLVDGVVARLEEKCLNLIGLARRSGELVSGFDKVSEQLKKQRQGVLVLASDVADNGREKAVRAAGERQIVDRFDRTKLSLALGRENVVHAAIAQGRLAERLLTEVARFDRVAGAGDLARGQDDGK